MFPMTAIFYVIFCMSFYKEIFYILIIILPIITFIIVILAQQLWEDINEEILRIKERQIDNKNYHE